MPGEEKKKAPSYIVTFSDMVTLLLTFFVLLLTLAEVRDPELFNKGRDSFLESIRLCGLGALFGRDVTRDLGADQVKDHTTEPETSQDRTIDEYREKLRQVFERINQSTTTLPSQLVGQQLHFSVTDVRFASGQATLDEAARESLSRFCMNVQQNVDAETSTLYVLGLAGDEATQTQQWILSARRAEAVACFVREMLAKNVGGGARTEAEAEAPPWRVLSWGAGPGGNWAGQGSPDPGESQILIAVLKAGD